MVNFSVMHKSHLFDPQENAYAFDLIDHVILNGMFWSFNFHMYSDRVVTFSLGGLFSIVALCTHHLCLKLFFVIPVYIMVLFAVVTCAWYTTDFCRQ